MMPWIYLAIAIAAEVLATSFLRSAAGFTKPLPTAIVLAGYGIAFAFLSLTLDRIPTGIGYAVWSGVGVTLVAAIDWAWHGQRLDAAALVGIGLIVAGVLVLNLVSKSAVH